MWETKNRQRCKNTNYTFKQMRTELAENAFAVLWIIDRWNRTIISTKLHLILKNHFMKTNMFSNSMRKKKFKKIVNNYLRKHYSLELFSIRFCAICWDTFLVKGSRFVLRLLMTRSNKNCSFKSCNRNSIMIIDTIHR